ncbi:zeta toxin family protein [Clostridium sp. D2Q-11]|uniref:UDP-N-acetylglucosamine kinase n=1 Tax=Anaeromonas frigoriresistens TaxID=2683708 RepID=A0A942Z929_9FIRM|nr:zeta toxin family protein [Anaeromonas frigoriresistens]MBS4538460.1 zeta toxin family protein [Anaeromonas frigoriresistens]
MVILIGGNSCTGKTNLSQNLLEKYKIPYLSIDHLKMGLYRSGMDYGFTPTDSNELIAEKLWPIIKGIIMTAIENNQNIIIEGCYLMPDFINDFEDSYVDNIISVFLGFSSDYITKNFESGILKNRCIIEERNYEEDRPVSQFIDEHEKFRNKCINYDVNYFEINSNYSEGIERVIDFIDSRFLGYHFMK